MIIKTFLTKSPYLIGKKTIEAITGLIIFALVAKYLSVEEYAAYGLVLTFMSVLGVFSFPQIGNAIGISVAKGKYGGYRKGTFVSLIASGLLSFVFLMVALVNYIFGNTILSQGTIIVAILLPFILSMNFWSHVFIGEQRFNIFFYAKSASAITRLVFVYLFIFFEQKSFYLFFICFLSADVIINICLTIWCFKYKNYNTINDAKEISYGIKTSLYSTSDILATNCAPLFIYYHISPAAAALYLVIMKIPMFVDSFFAEAISVLVPVFSKDPHALRQNAYLFICMGSVFFICCIGFGWWILPEVMVVVIEDKYPQDSIALAKLAMVAIGIKGFVTVLSQYVKAQLSETLFLKATVMLDIPKIALTVILIYFFGVDGAIYAFIVHSLISTIMIYFIVSKDKNYGKHQSKI